MDWKRHKASKKPQVERVYIAVLAGDNKLNTSLAQLATEAPLVGADASNRFQFMFHVESGVRGQELARNRVCKRFLESDGDTLVMIDNDMVVTGWETMRVLDTPDYDIAAPIQMSWDCQIDEAAGTFDPRIKYCAFVWDEEGGGHRETLPAPGVSVQPVDAVGSGFICIKRRVLEDDGMLLAPGMDPPAYFRTRVQENFSRIRGNDIDFCHRARERGYKIKQNWAARTGHMKTVDLYHIELYAKQQFVMGLQAGRKDALRVEAEEGRPEGGSEGRPGSDMENNPEVDRVQLD